MMEHEMTIGGNLFDRVVQILEQARSNVVQSVNTNMVTAYWLIGREIVIEVQCGKERAVYGKQVIEVLSQQLSEQYGKGYSTTNLWYFRQFFQVYADRIVIPHPPGGELRDQPKSHPSGGQFPSGFSSQLSWSHYRALMRVSRPAAREFYLLYCHDAQVQPLVAQIGWTHNLIILQHSIVSTFRKTDKLI
jgi:hypothetical protein